MCPLLTGTEALNLGDSQKPQENRSLGQDLNAASRIWSRDLIDQSTATCSVVRYQVQWSDLTRGTMYLTSNIQTSTIKGTLTNVGLYKDGCIHNDCCNWLPAWSTDFLKLTVTQLVKKAPALYGTQRFITVLITAHNLSLSKAKLVHYTPSHIIFYPCQ